MNLRHTSMVLALMGLLLTCSCTIDVVQQKHDYVENVELRLREVTVRIDELEYLHHESRESGMTESPELAQTLAALNDKQEVVVKKLDEVRHAGVANWKGVRSSMDAALQDLERSCDVATFMLEEALLDMQESGMSRRYLLVSCPVVRHGNGPVCRA